MNDSGRGFDLTAAKAEAESAARHWGRVLGQPFAMSSVSYVAAAGDAVIKVAWGGDDESLHEGDALALWGGEGAVRLIDRCGRALLLERVVPGTDLSELDDDQATACAVALALRLWRPACPPFRSVVPAVRDWIAHAERSGSESAPLARELLGSLDPAADWVVHGDFHHHNILRQNDSWLAIDPKPYLADREYDVPAFLWNPISNRMGDRELFDRRIAAFVAAGLDDFRIRAWTVIRGSYLRPGESGFLRSLLAGAR